MIAAFVAAMSTLPLVAAQVATVAIDDGSANLGEEDIVSIMINNVPVDIMTADVTLTYDKSVVHVISVGGSHFDNCFPSIDNVTGMTRIAVFQAVSAPLTGNVKLCDVTLRAVGNAGETSPLNIEITRLEAGNESVIQATQDNGIFVINNNPPTVEITSPEDDTWFDSESVSITFYPQDAEDMNVDYRVYVDEEEKASGISGVGEDTPVNLGILPECDHVIKVEVTDSGGLTDSAEITIHVDLTPPTVDIISPENDTWFDNEDVTVTFYPRDNKAGILNYMVYVDGDESENGQVANCTEKEVNLGVLPDSDYVIKVEVTDKAGKIGSDEVTIHVATSPSVSDPSAYPSVIPDDTDNDPRWGEIATLNVTVLTERGIASVTVNLSAIGGSAVQPMTNIEGNIWSVTTNASAGTDGWTGAEYAPYQLQVNATDVNGKSNTSISIALTVMKNGDVSGNGLVTLYDATYISKWYLGEEEFGTLIEGVADVSGNGVVTLYDATYISKWYLDEEGFEVLH